MKFCLYVPRLSQYGRKRETTSGHKRDCKRPTSKNSDPLKGAHPSNNWKRGSMWFKGEYRFIVALERSVGKSKRLSRRLEAVETESDSQEHSLVFQNVRSVKALWRIQWWCKKGGLFHIHLSSLLLVLKNKMKGKTVILKWGLKSKMNSDVLSGPSSQIPPDTSPLFAGNSSS